MRRPRGVVERVADALRRLAAGRGRAGDERYRREWNVAARGDPLRAILTPPDRHSAVTARSFDEKGRQDAAWLRGFLRPGAVVLDVGCGVGRIERHLAPHAARLLAVDVSDEMLRAARAWTAGRTNIEFHRASATALAPIATASVDLAFSFFVLQHLEHEDAFRGLREIARVLSADGRAVLQFPSLASPLYRREFVRHADLRVRPVMRVRPYTAELVSRLLDLAGLVPERFESPHGGSFTIHELVVVARRRPDPPEVRAFAIRPLTAERADAPAEWAITATVTDVNGDLAGGRVTLRIGPDGPAVAAPLDGATLAGDALALRLALAGAAPGRVDLTLTVEDAVGVAAPPIAFHVTLAGAAAAPAPALPVARLSPLGGRRPAR